MTRDIYLISGLGADRRVFSFLDLSSFNVHYVDWIDPMENETIESYSSRLLTQIRSASPILLGVSFGGLIAIEISKQITTEKVILISTVKTKSDIPLTYRLIGNLRFDQMIPARFLKKVNSISYWFFGVKSDPDKKLLKTIIEETDSGFLKWALHQVVIWKNESIPGNSYHIHGDADRILPAVKSNKIIKDGGHFMIVNRAKEISDWISSLILN